MDPLTQGLIGGVAVQALPRPEGRKLPAWIGVLGGMAPDLDVLIRSDVDPLLFWEYHRHFTHSLAFIPIGGFLLALILYLFPWVRRRYSFYTVAFAALVGWATHGVLDAMTSYGTLLFWPFSDTRVTWNLISIIDPIFTGSLFIGFFLTWRMKSPRPARWVLAIAILYLGLGLWQHQRAQNLQDQLAAGRGHEASHRYLNPSFANLLVWRSIYQNGNQFYVDAFRLPPWGAVAVWEGGKSLALDPKSPGEPWDQSPSLLKDLGRFAWFSQGFLTPVNGNRREIGDLRYSLQTAGTEPLWGIGYDPTQTRKIKILRFHTDRSKAFEDLEDKLKGKAPDQIFP